MAVSLRLAGVNVGEMALSFGRPNPEPRLARGHVPEARSHFNFPSEALSFSEQILCHKNLCIEKQQVKDIPLAHKGIFCKIF
jgi:hypothetical protein